MNSYKNGYCALADKCNFAHAVSELEVMKPKNYTNMNRKLIEMEGTATIIYSFFTTKVKVKMQRLNKRSYNIILPKVIFDIQIYRVAPTYKNTDKKYN